jgi:type II secretory pathway pseudopilin PulG
MRTTSPRSGSGFTQVELLVVMAVIAVLIALLLPAVQKLRGASQRTQCQSQLRQLGIALHASQDAYGAMPRFGQPDYSWPGNVSAPVTTPGNYAFGSYFNMGGTTHFYLLPFVDQSNLMIYFANRTVQQVTYIASTFYWYSSHDPVNQLAGGDTPPPRVYLCPSDPSGPQRDGVSPKGAYIGSVSYPVGVTNYLINWQTLGYNSGSPKVPSSFPDGVSTTALMYEGYAVCGAGLHGVSGATGGGDGGPGFYNGWANLAAGRSVWDMRMHPCCWNYNGHQDAQVYGGTQNVNTYAPPGTTDGFATVQGIATNPVSNIPYNAATNPYAVFQQLPAISTCNSLVPQSMHSTGINVLMADASVKSVSPSVSSFTWSAAVTPRGREVVGPDW